MANYDIDKWPGGVTFLGRHFPFCSNLLLACHTSATHPHTGTKKGFNQVDRSLQIFYIIIIFLNLPGFFLNN